MNRNQRIQIAKGLIKIVKDWIDPDRQFTVYFCNYKENDYPIYVQQDYKVYKVVFNIKESEVEQKRKKIISWARSKHFEYNAHCSYKDGDLEVRYESDTWSESDIKNFLSELDIDDYKIKLICDEK